jgi:uncharacterized protein DUF2188
MAYARYHIVRQRDVWTVKFNDEEYGPFPSHAEALVFATEAAKKLSEHGEPAKVVWVGEMDHGHFHHEWTYGQARAASGGSVSRVA